jgi:nucleoside-specific outer membrane channel protein Tsx
MNRTVILAALLALAAPAAARADFATTNLQLLYGWNFHDPSVGSNTDNGKMSTITVNHFDDWAYGDNFFFVDMMQGNFTDPPNGAIVKSHLYGEYHPRVFVNRLLGAKKPALGIFQDWGLAGEVNLGNGFQAYMGGLGVNFVAPKFWVLGLNVYYRYSQVQLPGIGNISYDHTWQVSPFWTIPFSIGNVPFVFTGFLDADGIRNPDNSQGWELMTQPELLVDLLALTGGPKNKLLVGVEWYLHYATSNVKLGAPHDLDSAPQAMIQWNLH